jgi:membrane protease YdiL (CAAX protease family)
MTILIASLPILAIILVANILAARGSDRARIVFNLLLFLFNLLLLAAGIALQFVPLDGLELPEMGLQLLDQGLGSITLIGMGLWGMLVSLRPVRTWLGRILPALEPESPVHTLALATVGYLVGNAAISFSPGALDTLAEAQLEATLVDVLAQQFVFVLAAFMGVGLLTRRDGAALNQRLGLQRPTLSQIWTGVRWMLFFVILQACISTVWMLFDAAQVEQLSGINESLLGDFDTVWEWFLLAASAGLGEEMLFRGALQPIFGILPTSLIFALSHIQYGLSPATLTVFLLSVVLGVIRKRSNTTVAILVHAGYNFILGLLSLLALYLESVMRQMTPP